MDIEKRRAYASKWRRENRDKVNVHIRKYRRNNPVKVRKWNQISTARRRREIFDILGGAICVRCGFDDVRALQIDHVNGCMGIKRIGVNTRKMVDTVRENKNNYQILCANCNWIKKYENDENVGTSLNVIGVYEHRKKTEKDTGDAKRDSIESLADFPASGTSAG